MTYHPMQDLGEILRDIDARLDRLERAMQVVAEYTHNAGLVALKIQKILGE